MKQNWLWISLSYLINDGLFYHFVHHRVVDLLILFNRVTMDHQRWISMLLDTNRAQLKDEGRGSGLQSLDSGEAKRTCCGFELGDEFSDLHKFGSSGRGQTSDPGEVRSRA